MISYPDADFDTVLCHCDLEQMRQLVERLEGQHSVRMIQEPKLCLTMVRAEDSLEKQEFYLGEALTTECEVSVNGIAGYGVCLGEEPVRTYCMAVLDSLREQNRVDSEFTRFLSAEQDRLRSEEEAEFRRILSTRVDFKLLEQE